MIHWVDQFNADTVLISVFTFCQSHDKETISFMTLFWIKCFIYYDGLIICHSFFLPNFRGPLSVMEAEWLRLSQPLDKAYWELDPEAETGRHVGAKMLILTKAPQVKKASSIQQGRLVNSASRKCSGTGQNQELMRKGSEVDRTEKTQGKNTSTLAGKTQGSKKLTKRTRWAPPPRWN